MLRNYLKITLRGLVKNKLFTFINVFGLALGITGCLLLTMHIWDELTFDQFHEKKNNIYQLSYHYKDKLYSYTSPPLANAIQESLPEVKQAVRFYEKTANIQIGSEAFTEEINYVDPIFFDMFNYPFLEGSQENLLQNPQEILLTHKIALKYFGEEPAIGKTLRIRSDDWSQDYDFIVTGILADIPGNSSLQFDIILPISFLEKVDYSFQNGGSWQSLGPNTFIEVNEGVNISGLENKIIDLVDSRLPDENRKRVYSLLPLLEIHFADVNQRIIVTSKLSYVYILASLAALILIIACINFTSLSISQSSRRTKEVGMRKTMGASRKQLIIQFLSESLLMTILSFILSAVLLTFSIGVFNDIVGKALSFKIFSEPIFLILIGGLIILTGFLSGSYPALILSSFSPDTNLRQKFKLFGNKQLIAVLATFQFILSSFLIISTFLMNEQMQAVFSKNLGFKEDFVLKLKVPHNRSGNLLDKYRNELSNESVVKSVSGSWNEISSANGISFNAFDFEVQNRELKGKALSIDHKLLNTLQVQLKKGRMLSSYDTVRSYKMVIVNEKFVTEAGLKNPIGTVIDFPAGIYLSDLFLKAEIVGVVEDFHYESLHQTIAPLIIQLGTTPYYSDLYIRLAPNNLNEGLSKLTEKWKVVAPDLPFDYEFMDEVVKQQYEADQKWLTIGFYASGLAIFIACMGMFGLAAFSSAQRVKEIGIRKVMGASVSSILMLLSKDYIKLVLLAYIIAVPLANYVFSVWLESFAFKIAISWWYFLITGIIVSLIAILTVSGQSFKASVSNPIDCLRNE
ncbi:ABC transporter permease [Chondrinema litorale]|uniref:ABC transporter permease n=1 Tax=Chondrinema litorale TaxID=2994555 RepID=UPI002542B22F|nr:ABC transporter permease [Chondrinema litorale]UZR98110.1 ABC transporter permease [Chondrinema litorale]